jgi:hypothetical protein
MSVFEKLILGLLTAATAEAPIFIHTPQGIAVFNASEILLASILAQFAPKPVAAPVAAPVAVAVAV